MTAKVTERVDALNGKAGQVLHSKFSLSLRSAVKTASAKKPTKL